MHLLWAYPSDVPVYYLGRITKFIGAYDVRQVLMPKILTKMLNVRYLDPGSPRVFNSSFRFCQLIFRKLERCSKIVFYRQKYFSGDVMRVREIMQLKGGILYTATTQQSLISAVDAMAELDVGSLLIMQEGKMVGLLTFREVMLAIKQNHSSLDGLIVGDVMIRNPVTAFPDMEANDLRRLMIDSHSRYLPVLDGAVLMGVISFLDVAKAVLEEQNFENKMLKNYIKNWPEAPAN